MKETVKDSGAQNAPARTERGGRRSEFASARRARAHLRLGPAASLSSAMLFVWIVALHSVLIHFQNYSPFQRVANLESALLGARTPMVAWLVAAIDLLSLLLVARLALTSIPSRGGGRRWRTGLLGLPIAGLSVAWLEYSIVILLESLSSPAVPWGQIVISICAGLAAVAGLSFLVAQALHEGPDEPPRLWARTFIAVLPAALIFSTLAFILRRSSFFLLAAPMVGPPLRAAFDLWVLCRLIRLIAWYSPDAGPLRSPTPTPTPIALFAGMVALFLIVFTFAFSSLPKHFDATPLPPIVLRDAPIAFEDERRGGKTLISSKQMRVLIASKPFDFTVMDLGENVLLRLYRKEDVGPEARGATLGTELSTSLPVPFFNPGRLLKSRFRLTAASLEEVQIERRAGARNQPVKVRGKIGEAPMAVSFAFIDNQVLKISVESAPGRFRTTSLSVALGEGERALGLGAGSSRLDRRGESRELLVETEDERSLRIGELVSRLSGGRLTLAYGADESAWPAPFVWLSRGLAVFVTGEGAPRIDLGDRSPGVATFSCSGGSLHLYVIGGTTGRELLSRFSRLLGKRAELPAAALLPWSVAWATPGQEAQALRTEAQRLRRLGVPAEYIRARGEPLGPGAGGPADLPAGLAAALEEGAGLGVKYAFDDAATLPRGSPGFYEAARRGYLMTNRLGLPYLLSTRRGTIALIDFTNPSAAQWRGEVWRAARDAGFAGMFLDPAALCPPDATLYNGAEGEAARDPYPMIYARAAQKELGRDFLLGSDYGSSGLERLVPLAWPPLSDGSGGPGTVEAEVTRLLNLGLSGGPVSGAGLVVGADRGGSGEVPVEAALGALGVGSASPLLVLPHAGRGAEVEVPAELMDLAKNLAEDHVRLLPYLYSLALVAARGGPPAIQAPFLTQPEKPEWYELRDQYLLGPGLLVALPLGGDRRDVSFPPGRWLRLDRLEFHGEGVDRVQVRGGRPLLFLAEGSLLPLFGEAFPTLAPARDPAVKAGSLENEISVLWISGPSATMVLFDGARLSARRAADSILFRVEGGSARPYAFVIYDADAPLAAFAGGLRLPDAELDYLESSRVLTLPAAMGPELTVEVLVRGPEK